MLASATHPVFFLDLDGTLAPIVPRPEAARVPPATCAVLQRLRGTGARVVLVSGRSALDAVDIARCDLDGVIGNHGADHIAGGRRGRWLPGSHRPIVEAHRRLRRQFQDWPGVRVERKEFSLAVHFREAPRSGPALLHQARRVLNGAALSVQPGRQVLDVKLRMVDKGKAVRRWLERTHPPADAVVYAGDDTTDEDAFRALRGRGITIAVGRRTAGAMFRTPTPASLRRWLDHIARARHPLAPGP